MFTNPYLLAMISMIVGMVIGVCCCVLALMIYVDVHDERGRHLPSEEDINQMCLWYEAEYGEGKND